MSLKVDIAQMQDRGEDSKDGRLVVRGEAEDFHGGEQTSEVICIAFSSNKTVSSLCEERSSLRLAGTIR